MNFCASTTVKVDCNRGKMELDALNHFQAFAVRQVLTHRAKLETCHEFWCLHGIQGAA